MLVVTFSIIIVSATAQSINLTVTNHSTLGFDATIIDSCVGEGDLLFCSNSNSISGAETQLFTYNLTDSTNTSLIITNISYWTVNTGADAYSVDCELYNSRSYCVVPREPNEFGAFSINLDFTDLQLHAGLSETGAESRIQTSACDLRPSTDEIWCWTYNAGNISYQNIIKYDIGDDNWTVVSNMPNPLAEANPGESSQVLRGSNCEFRNGNELWCFGGQAAGYASPINNNYFAIYNLTENNVTYTPSSFTGGFISYAPQYCRWRHYSSEDILYCYGNFNTSLTFRDYFYYYAPNTPAEVELPGWTSGTGLGGFVQYNSTTDYYLGGIENDFATATNTIYRIDFNELVIGDTQAPASVTNLTNVSQDNQSIFWQWVLPDDSDFNTSILFLNGANIVNLSSPISEYNATGLTNNTQYTLTIHTMDHTGNINDSDVNSTAVTSQNIQEITQTPTPTGFGCPSLTNQSIYCSWIAQAADRYLIFRNGSNIANTTNTFYNDTGLASNTSYSHYIKAYNSNFTIPLSNQSGTTINLTSSNQASLPPSSINVTLLSPANNEVLEEGSNIFTFRVNSSNLISYCTMWLKTADYANNTNVTSGSVSNFTIDLTPDNDYSWRVQCFDQAGENTSSETRIFTVIPEIIGKSTAGGTTGDKQQLIPAPVNTSKQAVPEESPVEEARNLVLDNVNEATGRFDKIWQNIPLLGTLDFKQVFLAGAILFLVWQFIYKSPARRIIS